MFILVILFFFLANLLRLGHLSLHFLHLLRLLELLELLELFVFRFTNLNFILLHLGHLRR